MAAKPDHDHPRTHLTPSADRPPLPEKHRKTAPERQPENHHGPSPASPASPDKINNYP
jgi:hypothetical protein